MALMASDVKVPQDLSNIFSGIGTNAYNRIGQNYKQADQQAATDAAARGFSGGPTDYATGRLGTTEGLDIGDLETGLGKGLGTTAYQDQLNTRSYDQQRQLAEATADAMRPSMLEQIFAGIGGGANALGSTAALMKMWPKGSGGTGTPITSVGTYQDPDLGEVYI